MFRAASNLRPHVRTQAILNLLLSLIKQLKESCWLILSLPPQTKWKSSQSVSHLGTKRTAQHCPDSSYKRIYNFPLGSVVPGEQLDHEETCIPE